MKNPLRKRIKRELKAEFGKYAVIFLFMVMLISAVSSFIVVDDSMYTAYKEGFDKYNLEDGHFSLLNELTKKNRLELENKGNISIYDMSYKEYALEGSKANIRIYEKREHVNLECLMSGDFPKKDNEIALDRMFAQNSDIRVGDTIKLAQMSFKVTGLVAVPDYSCLFENNADMMFDSVNFSIAVMTKEGFDKLGNNHITYNYAFKYNESFKDDIEQQNMSQKLLKVLNSQVVLTDYLPRYANKAINFTGDDMGSDKIMFIIFDYIVIAILAFVFAITTSNTIASEAGVIGTLRASGYTKNEIIKHYMVLPIVVTLIAGVIGNILGYTVMKQLMVSMYYSSYSLCTYKTLWSSEAFVLTTLIPIVIMFVINLLVLYSKMKLSPLRFIRHDLSKRGKKKAFKLNTKIPFIIRFRIRILFQNIPNYVTLFIGIMFASFIMIFSIMFGPMLDDYAQTVTESELAKYQYILKLPQKTAQNSAEQFCMTSLKTDKGNFKEEEILVYGISDKSEYINKSIPKGKVLVSNGYMDKYEIKIGDSITLINPFGKEKYDFVVAGSYKYDAALTVFMNKDEFNEKFDYDKNYFTGYFSNEKIEDIDELYVSGKITEDDLKKISTQLKVSMGGFMNILKVFGIFMFLLLMYLLSKQIIEKNSKSISIVKILGYSGAQIGGLYIVATSIVVILSLVLTIPIVHEGLMLIFSKYLYTEMTGYIPFIISKEVYIYTFITGILCYAFVAILQLIKINRIPKSDALKNVE